jgi:hypothetical protein
MHPSLIRFVYKQSVKAIEDLFKNNYHIEGNAREIINSCTGKDRLYRARHHCNEYKIEIPKPPNNVKKLEKEAA